MPNKAHKIRERASHSQLRVLQTALLNGLAGARFESKDVASLGLPETGPSCENSLLFTVGVPWIRPEIAIKVSLGRDYRSADAMSGSRGTPAKIHVYAVGCRLARRGGW
jgi:hypothetical protein